MEELRLQLFLFFLNYWRLYKNMGVDMGDITRAICESMPDIPVCALEGCDTILFGYRPDAFYCSRVCGEKGWNEEHPEYTKEQTKAWREANPEYMKGWREENQEHIKDHMKKYNQSRAGKAARARFKENNPDYWKEYSQTPEYKAYQQTPKRKAALARANKKYRARKKAERLAAEEQTST